MPAPGIHHHCLSADPNNTAALRHENLEQPMGATITTDKKVAAFVHANGDTVYFTFEETYEKNVTPHTPNWGARAVGNYDDVMLSVMRSAAGTEGGGLQTRSGYTTPELYLQSWRRAFKAPVPMPDQEIEISLGGTSFRAPIEDEDVDPAIAALTKIGRQDLIDALRAGPITLQLHADIDIIIALYGVRTQLPLWKILRNGPPYGSGAESLAPAKRKAPVMAPTVVAYRVDQYNVLVSVGGSPYQHMGWDYSAVGQYILEIVLPLELRCDGAAKAMINAFRDKLSAAPPLPESTTITVTPAAGQSSYQIDSACQLAVKLGVASEKAHTPQTYKVTFGDVKAAEAEYQLSTLQACQTEWTLALNDDAAAATLLSGPAQSYTEQAALF